MDRKAMMLGMLRRILQPKEIVVGKGSLNRLAAMDCRRALVIASRSVVDSDPFSAVTSNLAKAGVDVQVWSGQSVEPDVARIRELSAEADRFEPNWIIAVGGGSIIDAAKLAWAVYEHPELPIGDDRPFAIPALRTKSRLAAIPTTAGSGSEASQAAVLSTASHSKLPIVSGELMPDLVILEPQLSTGLSTEQSLHGGMDALTHAIEAYASKIASSLVKALAVSAIKAIQTWLPRACDNGQDLEARQRMLDAAYLAGLCQSSASTGLAHALAHASAPVLAVGHAQGTGFFLPRVMRLNAAKSPDIYDELARDLGLGGHSELLDHLNAWMQSLPLSADLDSLAGRRPTDDELGSLRTLAMKDACLRTNPFRPAHEDIDGLLQESLWAA